MRASKKVTLTAAAALAAISLGIAPATVQAAHGDQGPDWSKYDGAYGKFGYSSDEFVVAQLGGVYAGYGYVDQATYSTQVASAIAAGKRAHTYIWYQVGGSTAVAQAAMNRFLPRVQTPKGSIVALDYEAGASSNVAANTNAVIYGLQRIKDAGYTPVLYSGKSYIYSHLNWSAITSRFGSCGWIAEYPNNAVRTKPDYNWFPSMPGVAMFQFTDMYRAGGLDASVDLTGITDNGYGKGKTTSAGKVIVTPKSSTAATAAGSAANAVAKSSISSGYTVKVNLGAQHWANGAVMPSWVRGKTYKVIQTRGNQVLLGGVMSWIDRSNVEALATASQAHSGLYVDGYWGAATTSALERHEGTPVDGRISGQARSNNIRGVVIGRGGSTVVRAMQRRLDVYVDGYLGPQTINAMQRALGTPHDGVISSRSRMVMVMQQRLNAGTLPF